MAKFIYEIFTQELNRFLIVTPSANWVCCDKEGIKFFVNQPIFLETQNLYKGQDEEPVAILTIEDPILYNLLFEDEITYENSLLKLWSFPYYFKKKISFRTYLLSLIQYIPTKLRYAYMVDKTLFISNEKPQFENFNLADQQSFALKINFNDTFTNIEFPKNKNEIIEIFYC